MESTPPTVPAGSGPSPENSLAVLMHLLGFAGMFVPFGNILAPLVFWLIKRSESPLLDSVGKEVINFQISFAIYSSIAALLIFILVGFVLLPIVLIAWIVLMIMAAIKTGNGESYRYPLTIRLLQ